MTALNLLEVLQVFWKHHHRVEVELTNLEFLSRLSQQVEKTDHSQAVGSPLNSLDEDMSSIAPRYLENIALPNQWFFVKYWT